jgi:hypothetical protein
MRTRRTPLDVALAKIGQSARRKAFRGRRPVAISVNGKAFLLYANGSKKEVTPQTLEELKNGNF